MPTPLLIPLVTAAATATLGGVASAIKGGPEGPPKPSDAQQEALGSFAQRLADQEKDARDPGGGFKLSPTGKPIRFMNPSRLSRGPITYT